MVSRAPRSVRPETGKARHPRGSDNAPSQALARAAEPAHEATSRATPSRRTTAAPSQAQTASLSELAAVAGYFRELLDLLHREAPAADIERSARGIREAALPPELLADLDAGKLTALGVYGMLEQRRRREAELAALFESASDLAALHDLDSVLHAIVRRARMLLGTDVAYMTLQDPAARDTYMRVTSGSVSAYFQQVRLGMGEGLGGLVAEQAAPYATSAYLTDERFLHTEPIDRAVREEGLVAILGVPLLLGTSVIGVLFAADRRTRTFGPAEVSLLTSLAAHAAIAIDAANLLEETRAAVADLNAANEIVKEHSAAVERASQAHHRFTELVLAGGKAENVAQAVSSVLGSDVLLLDEHGSPIAASGTVPEDAMLLRVLAEARAGRRAVHAGGLWAAPASAGSEHLGTVVLRAGPDLPETDRIILERAAMVTALLLLLRRSVAEAEQQLRGDLLTDLLSTPHRDADSLRHRALRLGVDLDQAQVVVVVRTDPTLLTRLRATSAHLAATRHGLAASFEGNTVLLLPGDDPASIASDAASALQAGVGQPVTAASDGTRAHEPSSGPAAIASAYLQASRCADALLALGRGGSAATPEDLGFLGLLLSDRKDVPAFIRSTIGTLIDYDARKRTELIRTVEAYFCAGGNVTRTKDALHVHVNTVTQRLERISRLLGDDWQLGQRALEIRIAVHLHRVGAERWAR
jgi:sugar diacid utilization regulator